MLHPPIAARRSPRAFDPLREITAAQVALLLEAARWAPSAMNRQPWVFAVGLRGDDTFKAIADALSGNNQLWAPTASALVLALVDNGDESAPTDPGRAYEVGLAVGQLGIQAQAMGLITHQMGGFDRERLREELAVPRRLRPLAVIAAGHQGDPADLPDSLRAREDAPRERRQVADLLHVGEPRN